jgi:hypothetical protein
LLKPNEGRTIAAFAIRRAAMTFDVKKMLKPEVNVGLKDQKVRYGVGITALLVSVFLANIPLLFIGGILVGTARFRWCPAYSGLGKSTVQPGEPATCCSGHHHESEDPNSGAAA